MQDILLALLALSGVAAIARQLLPLLVARQTCRRTQDAAQEAHEEWQRRQAERNRKRVDRQAELDDWTRQWIALQPPPPAQPKPQGEPLAVIRAWDGAIVGKIYDQPPPVPTNSDPFNLLEDLTTPKELETMKISRETPDRIARLALAVELESGETIRIYSAEVSGTVTIETEQDVGPVEYYGMPRPYPPRTSITIEGIRACLIHYNDPNATKAIEQTREEIAQ